MSEHTYLASQHAAESLTTGQFVAGLAIVGFWAIAAKLMPHSQEAIDKALTLNRGRRASDRAERAA